jgi:hypothetical protein
VRSQRHAPAAIYPRERPGTHCTRGYVDPRDGLDSCGKSRLPLGFDSRTVHSVASRYTDYATRPTRDNARIVYFTDTIIDNYFQMLLVTYVVDGGYGNTVRYNYLAYYGLGFTNFVCRNSMWFKLLSFDVQLKMGSQILCTNKPSRNIMFTLKPFLNYK